MAKPKSKVVQHQPKARKDPKAGKSSARAGKGKSSVVSMAGRTRTRGGSTDRPSNRRTAKPAKAAPEVRVALQPAQEDPATVPVVLGPISIPEGAAAVQVLTELATMNDRVIQAAALHADSAARTKRLKGELDGLADALSKRLRSATHPTPLPLFDQGERDGEMAAATVNRADKTDRLWEFDRARLTGGPDAETAGPTPEGADPAGEVDAGAATSALADEDVPF